MTASTTPLIPVLFLPLLIAAVPPRADRVHEVGAGREHATIQSAIDGLPDNASGHTVLIYPGRYAEQVVFPDGLTGKEGNHLVIRAAFPARQPLAGGDWASDPSQRSVLDVTGLEYGFASDYWTRNHFVTIDGLWVENAATNGIYFAADHRIWIRNNVFVNNGVDRGENSGGVNIEVQDVPVGEYLIQNNLCRLSAGATTSWPSCYQTEGPDGIVEYNECHLNAPAGRHGVCYYGHGNGNSDNTVVRYNYFHMDNPGDVYVTRQRLATGYDFHNNLITSLIPTWFSQWEENEDHGTIENHRIHHNTWLLAGGRRPQVLGFRHQNGTAVFNNIVQALVPHAETYVVGNTYDAQGNHSLTVYDNRWWNWAGVLGPNVCATSTCEVSETGNVEAETTFDDRGCAVDVDNAIYGSNLDVSRIPYRACDGSELPIASR